MFKLEKNIKSTKEEIKSVFDPSTQSFSEEVLGVR